MIKVTIISRHVNKKLFKPTKDISFLFPRSLDEAFSSTTDILVIDEDRIPDNIGDQTKVLVVGNETKEKVLHFLNYPNFHGFLKHDISQRLMVKAVRMVAQGEMWVNRSMISMVFEEFSKHIRKSRYNNDLLNNLSAREKEILDLVSRGNTNKDVAKILFISEKTVKTHLKNIFRKLGVNKRTEAISLLFQ